MHDRKNISTFTLSQPVNEQVVELLLCLFSSHSMRPGSKQFSYSIVGKINGLTCNEGIAKITTGYPLQRKLTDELSICGNRFIYCNKSVTPVALDIHLRLITSVSWQGVVDVNFTMKLRYSLNKFIVHAINSSFSIKNKTKPKMVLMQ